MYINHNGQFLIIKKEQINLLFLISYLQNRIHFTSFKRCRKSSLIELRSVCDSLSKVWSLADFVCFVPSVARSAASVINASECMHSSSFLTLSFHPFSLLGQAFDRLVTFSLMHYCTYTYDLSTLSSSRGLIAFAWDISS